MGGDYTRFTFNPAKGYTGVLKQQGRVSLDADHNELVDIDERRTRVEMMDTVGRCAVPATTPNGFAIGVSGNQITIGVGRAYVDGVLAECRGEEPWNAYDPATGELRSAVALSYAKQPFFYSGPNIAGYNFPAASTTAGAVNLLYLHARQREVTVIEDPALLEPALGGPDTSTRYQTEWQVKAIPVTATWCEDAPTPYTDIIAPSTGRLTTGYTPATSTTPGPCVIEPAGGYTGLENRLYRVEVRKSGGYGTAEFVWSRDNASLNADVSEVKTIAGRTEITVSRLGWDQVVKLKKDDWIELLDDDIEFAQYERGLSGQLVQIADVDEPNSKVYVNGAVAFTVTPARHPRVRRWDTDPDTPGQAVSRTFTSGTAIALEKGVQITFTNATGTASFRAGDYWVFWARTATGKIEILTAAPARGPVHHFCKLALVTWGTTPSIRDCRDLWPGPDCCTVIVKPGRDVQRAIDSLPPAGGCVCLKAGVHEIFTPLVIKQSNVCIHGEAPGTIVRNANGEVVLRIVPVNQNERLSNISVETLRFEGAVDPGGMGAMLDITRVSDFSVRDCQFAPVTGVAMLDAVAIMGTEAHHGVIEENSSNDLLGGVYFTAPSAAFGEHTIRNNDLTGPTTQGMSAGLFGIRLDGSLGSHVVTGNRIAHFGSAIFASAEATGTVLIDNTVTRNGPMPQGTQASNEPFDLIVTKAFAIEVRAANVTVARTVVPLSHFSHGGILARAGAARIEHNRFVSSSPVTGIPAILDVPWGVVVGGVAASYSTVRVNTFAGAQSAIGVFGESGQELFGVRVSENSIDGVQELFQRVGTALPPVQGDFENDLITGALKFALLIPAASGIFAYRVRAVTIESNRIRYEMAAITVIFGRDCAVTDNDCLESIGGVTVITCPQARVAHNRLYQLSASGVVVIDSQRVSVVGNSVFGLAQNAGTIRNTRVGVLAFSRGSGPGIDIAGNSASDVDYGIAVLEHGDVDIEGNELRDLRCTGIYVARCEGELACRRNRVTRCGAFGTDFVLFPTAPPLPRAAMAILVAFCPGLVTIEDCTVMGTGEPPDRTNVPPSNAARCSISAWLVERVRVHGCVVVEPRVDTVNTDSGALHCFTLLNPPLAPKGPPLEFDVVDVVDNSFEGDYNRAVWMMSLSIAYGALLGESVFASNRCTNLRPLPATSSVDLWLFKVVSATGNRVRVAAPRTGAVNSVTYALIETLSAVGNIAGIGTNTLLLNPEVPAPYAAFNPTA